MSIVHRIAVMTVAVAAASATTASASQVYFQGFEDADWAPDTDPGDWQSYNASLAAALSGTNGISSADGAAHAAMGAAAGGSYTRFGGYRSEFAGGFVASIDIYLDPAAWSDGEGFDYSVAANRQNGDHLRDFIWHVGMVDGEMLVNASNNSSFDLIESRLVNGNDGQNFTVSQAGWYTFQQRFFDDGGNLAVEFSLLDDSGTGLYSVTRSNSGDDIATTVGGNRYGWFTYNDLDGLAFDNVSLTIIPLPPAALAGLAGLAGVAMMRRRLRSAD